MKNGSICWFDIAVKDLGRAKKFYAKIFGWEFEASGSNNYVMIRANAEQIGGLYEKSGLQTAESGFSAYFFVPSLEEALTLVQSAGGAVVLGKTLISPEHGFFAKILDSEGNGIQLWSPK